MSKEGTAVIRRCVSCRKPITKQDYFINDDGPYCPDCIEAWACAGDQGAANLPPACSGNKPLRWRSGPVPVDELGFGVKVFYKLRDDWGYGIGAGEEEGGVFDGDWHIKKGDILCWLPLSEILELIGG